MAKASAANTDRIAKNKADADASFETLTKNQNTLIEKDKEHDKLITANKTAIDANKASADTKFAATADAITKMEMLSLKTQNLSLIWVLKWMVLTVV